LWNDWARGIRGVVRNLGEALEMEASGSGSIAHVEYPNGVGDSQREVSDGLVSVNQPRRWARTTRCLTAMKS
jgi:hypothetical protein